MTAYGSFNVSSGSPDDVMSFTLKAAALADLNAMLGERRVRYSLLR